MIDWFWVAVLAAIAIAFRLMRPFMAYVLGPMVSKQALAAQPDTIHLEPGDDAAWADAGEAACDVNTGATTGSCF